jgi:hypothetical protein
MSHLHELGCFPSTAIWHGEIFRGAPALPLGRWHVMANGRIHSLNIISVSGSRVTGEYNGLPIDDAQWDGKVLTFTRVETRGISLRQKFMGYLMQYVDPDYKWRIAGVFGAAELDQHQAGWYATRPRAS